MEVRSRAVQVKQNKKNWHGDSVNATVARKEKKRKEAKEHIMPKTDSFWKKWKKICP